MFALVLLVFMSGLVLIPLLGERMFGSTIDFVHPAFPVANMLLPFDIPTGTQPVAGVVIGTVMIFWVTS